MEYEREEHELQLVIVGDHDVGKTTLLQHFANAGRFGVADVQPTMQPDCVQRVVKTEDGVMVHLSMWDTAGMERFSTCACKGLWCNADGIIILYDVTKVASYERVATYWIRTLYDTIGDFRAGDGYRHPPNIVHPILAPEDGVLVEARLPCQILIVANKVDLENNRRVTIESGKKLTNAFKLPYVQLSAAKDEQEALSLPFQLIASLIMKRRAQANMGPVLRANRLLDATTPRLQHPQDAPLNERNCC